MPTGKDSPFDVALIGTLLCLCLFADDASRHAASFSSPLLSHLVCHFYHANLFHLLGNLFCIVFMRPSMKQLLYAYPVAVAATWFTVVPSIGFSAVLYAFMGMNALRWNISRKDWCLFIIANLITAFIPGIAFSLHFAAFSLGIFVSLFKRILKIEGR